MQKIIALFFLTATSLTHAAITETRATIGTYQSRAIIRQSSDNQKHATIIMIPGSGANGPEEEMPASLTLDNRDQSLFQEFSEPLNNAGANTIAIGKPGVDYFTGFIGAKWFYDQALYNSLTWQNLIDNVHAAVDFALTLPSTDPTRVYVLGHSEGTQVVVDYAATDSRVKGIILLGYVGQDIATLVDWQLYHRPIEFFVTTDVDANKDGYVDKDEASHWPEFKWNWQPGQDRVSYKEIEAALRADPQLKAFYDKLANSPLYSSGIFHRGEINTKAAALKQDLYVFNGQLDMQAPAREALALKAACEQAQKANCNVSFVPAVGHAFSAPRPPRAQPVVDMTLGPVSPDFQATLRELAGRL
jgi:hypothetical protein